MLLLALVFGVIFIFIVPPWQHYDEPTHFEYSWLIANRAGLPSVGEYDQPVRREIAASMVEHGFYRDINFNPNLLSITDRIWIGISQIGSKPLYYWLAALPLRLIETTDITFQLYAERFVSLLFYLLTIAAAYGFAVEITPGKHPLRWLLPLTILLLPGLVDILTSVNDDVAATALFSLFLWTGIRMIKRGFNWLRVLALISLSLLCFYTKTTVVTALVLAVIPLLFSVIPPKRKRYVWLALIAAGILGVLALVEYGFPRNWYQENTSSAPGYIVNKNASMGKRVLAFKYSPDSSPNRISQLIPVDHFDPSQESTYTIGAWIWADRSTTVNTPTLHIADDDLTRQVEVSTEPQFFSFSESIPPGSRPYKISIFSGALEGSQEISVYYDGIILVNGDFEGVTPVFGNLSGESIELGGSLLQNIVRNASIEIPGITLRRQAGEQMAKILPGDPQLILGLIQDPAPLISYYQVTTKVLFHTFWARFGWGNVTLLGYRPYTILGIFTLVGLLGAVIAFIRKRREINWELVFFLGISMVVIWGAALLRGVTSYIGGGYFFPVARYAYPAVIPTMLVLNIGWLEITSWVERYRRIPRNYQLAGVILIFILLDLLSLYTIFSYYSK